MPGATPRVVQSPARTEREFARFHKLKLAHGACCRAAQQRVLRE
jgi:hypothetical protein